MATSKRRTRKSEASDSTTREITQRGIRTGADFINVMSAVMDDLAQGRMTSHTANAICNAGGKMLKCAEMTVKHGQKTEGKVGRVLELAPINEAATLQ